MTERDGRDELRSPELDTGFDDTMSSSQAAFEADLTAVHADDALLDALGGSDPEVADGLGDQELNALLLAWRRDIDSEPLAELVDADTAVTTVKTAALAKRHGQRAHKRRMLWPVAAAAAVLAIAFTGTSIAARDAQPGDTLWGLTKVLYADHARSVEAASQARTDLQQASIALSQGRLTEAQRALAEAGTRLGQVAAEDNLAALMQEHQQLSEMLQNPAKQSAPPVSSSSPTSVPLPPPPPTSAASGPPSSTTPVPPSSTTPTPTQTPTSTPPSTESSSPPANGTNTDGSTVRFIPQGGQPAGANGGTG